MAFEAFKCMLSSGRELNEWGSGISIWASNEEGKGMVGKCNIEFSENITKVKSGLFTYKTETTTIYYLVGFVIDVKSHETFRFTITDCPEEIDFIAAEIKKIQEEKENNRLEKLKSMLC